MSQQPFFRLLHGRLPQLRSFTRTSVFARRTTPRPTQRTVVDSQIQSSPSGNATGFKHAPSLKGFTPVPGGTNASLLLRGEERLLLYKAPKHKTFQYMSYFCGTCLVSWALMQGNLMLVGGSPPWWFKFFVLTACGLTSAMGMGMYLAPTKLIKSISVVKSSQGQALLRFEGRRIMPFLKPRAFEVQPGQVFANKDVPMTLKTWHDVEFRDGDRWTEGKLPAPEPALSPPDRLMSYVRRMFNRDGMVYMKVGDHGNWKLDLNECEILEGGSPLMRVIREDPYVQKSLAQMVRDRIS